MPSRPPSRTPKRSSAGKSAAPKPAKSPGRTSRKRTVNRAKSSAAAAPAAAADHIRIRGARQNNLQGIDVDIPLNQLTVVTGPSGSGKSSLAFQTLYAEGQRRYVETFSPYVRQFFDRMDKPAVDSIEGILPAIALEQANHVRSTRSTVGTITEINDYLKLLFPRLAVAVNPETGRILRPATAGSILAAIRDLPSDRPLLIAFPVPVPADSAPADVFDFLRQQGFLRLQIYGRTYRTDEPQSFDRARLPASVLVIQDRITPGRTRDARVFEALETALRLGKGELTLIDGEDQSTTSFSIDWFDPDTGFRVRPPTPGLFSFNHPLGACPKCRGFGRVLGIDLESTMPDPLLSIREGAVRAFQGETYSECQQDLERCAEDRGIDLDQPVGELSSDDREWILFGERGDPEELWSAGRWYGVRGFFDWLEGKAYKMHVRVFLSRYRAYATCPDCRGSRLQPEALHFQLAGHTLPRLWQMPVRDLARFFQEQVEPLLPPHRKGKRDPDATTRLVLTEIQSRLGFLQRVGLDYLTLDRPTRTLSGGELERVNLTTCLGASLVNTLFVLDEPSIGLHPRDTGRLIDIMRSLCDRGNTLVVVEHEESIIRAADHLIDIGPGSGEQGGRLVFAGAGGTVARAKSGDSLTLAYLNGGRAIATPTRRRTVAAKSRGKAFIELRGIHKHNLRNLDARFPLGVFCCVTGVSGSGKSTLVHSVLHNHLRHRLYQDHEAHAEAGRLRELRLPAHISEAVMVDQSPIARTPRSTPALFTGAFDGIRDLFAALPDAAAERLTPGFFSFNSGQGRCGRCQGAGFEKVEMQFLSDLYITCPDCNGSRYGAVALEYRLDDRNIADVLALTAASAVPWFRSLGSRKAAQVADSLQLLLDVGLGYLRLGQPLNTLSGGEAQRLKLVKHLGQGTGRHSTPPPDKLLIFDEPTTGLHFEDIRRLLDVFHRLVDQGHSLIVIEHNLDVIRNADWIIDLGPEAGDQGGQIIAEGTPEDIAGIEASHTGRFLRPLLANEASSARVAEAPLTLTYPQMSADSKSVGMPDAITIHGARHHNLKNIDAVIPRDQLVVVTGLSGSGKSSLAFDIVFAEGQRRFLDSMSPYARQFAEQLEKPDIDHISGVPPTVAIEQRVSQGGGKSTVGTVTEIHHFLRLLFAKVGVLHCPESGLPVERQDPSSIMERVAAAMKQGPLRLMAPVIRARKGFHTEVARHADRKGYDELFVDRRFVTAENFKPLERYQPHDIDIVVARTDAKGRLLWCCSRRDIGTKPTLTKLQKLVDEALELGKGLVRVLDHRNRIQVLNTRLSSPATGESFEEPDPAHFSFNSPRGWCPACRGYGHVDARALRRGNELRTDRSDSILAAELEEDQRAERADDNETIPCPECEGSRLNRVARAAKVLGHRIEEISRLSVRDARDLIDGLRFSGRDLMIARDILPEIRQRLRFMDEVGLGYLQLDRSAKTLSGGEAQRIRLAAQLGSNLRGVLYVLDEPTIGLHSRDNWRLLDTLVALRDKGNSLLVVEHDEDTMERADHIIDLGPGAGRLGGEIIAEGDWKQLTADKRSLTGLHLKQRLPHPMRGERRELPAPRAREGWLRLNGARLHNLAGIDARIPLGRLTVVSGVSGAGKSTLMRGVLLPAVRDAIERRKKSRATKKASGRGRKTRADQPWRELTGADGIEAIYEVDQSPIGKTSRSTPATYVKVFDEIRKLFAATPDARMRGFDAGRFSFNNESGRCPACRGHGVIKLEMNFLPSSHVPCEDCRGQRYNPATLEVRYNGLHIGDIMRLTISEAASFFEAHPKIHRTLKLLEDTGLGYLQLGQPSPTVSGGEAQRIKLVTELTRGIGRGINDRLRRNRAPDGQLYLIEEPTIGLHMEDVRRLIDVLHRLVDDGHTVIVIEHNIDVIAEADFVIEVGPEAGEAGGRITHTGTPEQLAGAKDSPTAPFLSRLLRRRPESTLPE